MMFPLILASALSLSVTAETDRSSVYVQGNSAHILYSDLDLQRTRDRQRLMGRIHVAAEILCDGPDADPTLLQPSAGRCFRLVMADGKSQANTIAQSLKH